MIQTQQRAAAASKPAPITKADIISDMADAMREITGAGGTADEPALSLRGFTLAQIRTHGEAARDKANAESTRRVS